MKQNGHERAEAGVSEETPASLLNRHPPQTGFASALTVRASSSTSGLAVLLLKVDGSRGDTVFRVRYFRDRRAPPTGRNRSRKSMSEGNRPVRLGGKSTEGCFHAGDNRRRGRLSKSAGRKRRQGRSIPRFPLSASKRQRPTRRETKRRMHP